MEVYNEILIRLLTFSGAKKVSKSGGCDSWISKVCAEFLMH